MIIYHVRAKIKNMGDRTHILYSTTDLYEALEYEEELKNRNDIIATIVTQVNMKVAMK